MGSSLQTRRRLRDGRLPADGSGVQLDPHSPAGNLGRNVQISVSFRVPDLPPDRRLRRLSRLSGRVRPIRLQVADVGEAIGLEVASRPNGQGIACRPGPARRPSWDDLARGGYRFAGRIATDRCGG